ncbi:glycosyltransferase family 2 protein [Thioclava sp. A2]|uniref:glycosyltransferase family 2 protein n=1 Tax=Thioclava sp. FCG-A2 TaxID=3080562 RepID=UPI00295599BF|nr:glycosyltransferase family 2 protein [Thioclava sp. A2]
MTKFSVLITCYNKEQMIFDAIMSAKNQVGVHEVLVVDDCSSDGSINQIRKHHGITVLSNAHNLGVSASTEIGIRHAHQRGADYIVLLDGDDILAPNAVQYYRSVLEKTGSDAIYSKVLRGTSDCRPLAVPCDPASNITIINDPFDFYLKRIRATTAVCARPLLMVETFNPTLRVQDHQIAFSIFKNAQKVVISDAITHYCSEGRGNTNLSADHLAVATSCVRMYAETYYLTRNSKFHYSYVDRSLRRALRIRHTNAMPWKYNLFLQIVTPFKKLLPTPIQHKIMMGIFLRLPIHPASIA